MGKTSEALQWVLETYGISQNRLATTMGVGRSVVYLWFNDVQDPSEQAIAEITAALEKIDGAAAREFHQRYCQRGRTSEFSDGSSL